MKVKILFLAIFVFFGIYISNPHIFVDDFWFLYHQPRLIQNFFIFLQDYTREHGIYRPPSLVYYYFIYSLYTISPAISQLIPWGMHVLCGFLLFKILLKQKLPALPSLLTSLVFVLHPFATEQYLWLSANPGTIVNLIFLLQLLVVQSSPQNTKPVFFLSLLSAFIYESTFFLFVPLSFLISRQLKKSFVKILLPNLLIPVLYFFTKIIIIPTNPRPLVNSFSLIIHHSLETFKNLVNTHLDPSYTQNFWGNYSLQGLTHLLTTPAVLIIFIFLIAFLVFTLLTTQNYRLNPNSKYLVFWLLVFLATIPPLVANKTFYFGFRSLFLPSITFFIFLFFLSQKILETNMLRLIYLTSLIFIVGSVLINITTALKYQRLYLDDTNLAQAISQSTPPNATVILKSETPLMSYPTFQHADHFISCFYYEWCAPAILQNLNNQIKYIAIQHPDGRLTLPTNTDQNFIFSQRPLVYLTYKTDKTLIVDHILP